MKRYTEDLLDEPDSIYIARPELKGRDFDQVIQMLKIPWQHYSEQDPAAIEDLIERNQGVSPTGGLRELKATTLYSPLLDTGDNKPVFLWLYLIEPVPQEKVEQLIRELLEEGIIEHANSPWQTSLFIPKRDGQEVRLCIGYRQVNKLQNGTQRPTTH